jgi:protein-disulfide isomerase
VSERRDRALKLASAIAFLALAAIAVLIVLSQSQSSGGDAGNIAGKADVDGLLHGIPQERLVLGKPGATVTLVEFGDLQCPFCKHYSEEVIPPVIEGAVRRGEAKLDFRNYTIIGPESIPAGAAAIAAGKQSRGWNFVEIFYRNQGEEDSGYVTDKFLTAVARAAGVPDISQWNRNRKSKAVLAGVEETTAEAKQLGFTGTPSFAIEGPGTNGLETLGLPSSAGDLEAAIAAARS